MKKYQFCFNSKNFSVKKIAKKCNKIIKDCQIQKNEVGYKKSQKFFKKNGFYYEECWDLDQQIAAFILPRLIYLRQIHVGTPSSFFKYTTDNIIINEKEGQEKWNECLETIIEAFYRILFVDELSLKEEEREKNNKIIKDGLRKFSDNYSALWD